MKNEELAALGETIRRDFQETGWFADDYLTAEDLSEFWAIEAEVHQIFHISYEFAALEAWLTSGFVPADLAGLNHRAVETATEESAAVSSWFTGENQRVGDQPSRAGDEPKGDKKREKASDSGAESRPQGYQTSVKGLKDLARLLESEHWEGRNSGSEVVHPRQAPGSATDVVPSGQFGRIGLPDSSPNFDLGSGPSDDRVAAFRRLSPSKVPSGERFSSRPIPEEEKAEETISPLLRNHPSHREKGSTNFAKGQGSRAPTRLSFDAQQAMPQSISSGHRVTSGHPSSADPSFKEESSLTRYTPNGDSSWELMGTRGNSEPPRVPRSSYRFLSSEQQEPIGEAHFQVERESEQERRPSHVFESDLGAILEAIAREIQREYKRFYGS